MSDTNTVKQSLKDMLKIIDGFLNPPRQKSAKGSEDGISQQEMDELVEEWAEECCPLKPGMERLKKAILGALRKIEETGTLDD